MCHFSKLKPNASLPRPEKYRLCLWSESRMCEPNNEEDILFYYKSVISRERLLAQLRPCRIRVLTG